MGQQAKHITLTDDIFKGEVLENERPVLVDLCAEWCKRLKE